MAKKKYNPMRYVKNKKPGKYKSAYGGQLKTATQNLATARDAVMNFKYDPMQDAAYQSFAKIYGARENQAAKDTMADAAMLNNGYQTSNAISAAQQARNQYNQELAALVPDLETNAYNRLMSNYGLQQDEYNRLMDADSLAYQRYRDSIADYQWGKSLDMDLYQYKEAQKKSSGGGGGGGGGGRRGGGGGGYSSGYGKSSGTDLSGVYQKAVDQINGSGEDDKYIVKKKTGKKTGYTSVGGTGAGGRVVK